VSLLTLINNVEYECKLPISSAVIGSSATQTRQLLGFANREGRELASNYDWPYLRKFAQVTLTAATGTYTATFSASSTSIVVNSATGITTSMTAEGEGIPINTVVTAISGTTLTLSRATTEAGTDVSVTFGNGSYALPSDFDRITNDTEWDQSMQWPMIGPISPQDWAWVTQGIVQMSPRRLFRIMGNDTTQFFVFPVPGVDDNGVILTFEYMSLAWCLPAVWVTGTSYAANATSSYGGRRYTTSAGGTSGAVPPIQVSGSASDGGVTWAYADNGYSQFVADTNVTILKQELIELGVIWRWKAGNGFAWEGDFKTYQDAVDRAIGRQPGAAVLNMARGSRYGMLISPWNVQDGNFPSS
jgi:hypothetical protein